MYRAFYHLSERPFSLLPDPAFLYISDQHRKALAKLHSGVLNRAGITVITGEIGSGKTTLIQHLVRELQDEVVVGVIDNIHPRFHNLPEWVLQAFDIDVTGSSDVQLHRAFVSFVKEQAAQGRSALLFVDEAQNMSPQVLEELRLLMNINVDRPAFQVVLVGQPELRAVLKRPDMRQFAQRVAVEHHLQALDDNEAGEYIQHRLRVAGGDSGLFDAAACQLIYQRSRGIPRLINSLCDTALEYGFEEKRERIDGALVAELLNDSVNELLLALEAPPSEPEPASPSANVNRDDPVPPTDKGEPATRPKRSLDEVLKALSDSLD